MALSKNPQLSRNDNEVFFYGGLERWAGIPIFFIMLFIITVFGLYLFDPNDSVGYYGFGFLGFMALLCVWAHIATNKYCVEIDNEKICAGSFRKKYIYLSDIKEIKYRFVLSTQGMLLILNSKGKCVLKISDDIQDFMALLKAIKARVPRNQVMYREGDDFGNWIEEIIK